MQLELSLIKKTIIDALKEDIGEADLTTDILISLDAPLRKAKIAANSQGVIAGIEIVKEVFHLLYPQTKFIKKLKDGNIFKRKDTLLEFEASPSAILKGERVALNFLQKLSGIATLTRKFVNLVSPYGVKILDTRKTTPNLRLLEKYAVKMGGGTNHRLNLSGAILIKDNHIKLVGSVRKAVELVKKNAPFFPMIEVEIKVMDEIEEVVDLDVDVVMLDNFDHQQLKKAMEIIRKKSPKMFIEISGGVNLNNVEAIAKLKPDFISVGEITHSAPSVDMSLKIL
ncbi:carboxylating nicotinate-nucleotide diphosphorylase [Candidatus Aerophobetes bacterium]|nr:carboxylating nicotinate-nucleotide diphosphorylase [Candidatus Aerophobetes bacterium]